MNVEKENRTKNISKSTCYNIGLNQKPIKEVKYNKDGDLLFGCGSDAVATMVNKDGAIIGSFKKEGGAINTICPLDFKLLTASSNTSLSTWDIETGQLQSTLETESMVKSLDADNDVVYFLSDNSMNMQGYLGRLDTRTNKIEKLYEPKISSTKGFIEKNKMIFGNEGGDIVKYDISNGSIEHGSEKHFSKITSVNPSLCRNFFVTSSLDATMKIVDVNTMDVKLKFKAEEPVNSASIFPTNDILVSGGGINARDVTMTKGKSTFDTNFYDIVTKQRIGFFNTHIGPINSTAVSPNGKQIATGGEDGRITLINLGDEFFNSNFTNLNKYA